MTAAPEPKTSRKLGRAAKRRHAKAERLRKKALSPLRILLMIVALPLTTAMLVLAIYPRATSFERHEAIIHLVAMAGCDAVAAIGFGHFREGEPGYHKKYDPDGDGVSCPSVFHAQVPLTAEALKPVSTQAPAPRSVGSAKFITPEN
ncbi:excalibur calcium-binding domain-containing protein [Ruegeria sp. HKCCD7255]|uniref:excalibur calcium-binding domain-containing protein n=1 Tax=Ruegeria sp. HKCCD7255 TaxID=2683004 RepID=UPI0020C3A384|nr:excalibur calcium-binding domain-containing protein [Ruegeria sp. HKCCD7255]